MPALFVTIVVTWIVALLLYMPPEFKSYSASVRQLRHSCRIFCSGVKGDTLAGLSLAEIKPLLNIMVARREEQFYLLFPVTMLVLARFGRKTQAPVIMSVLLISFACKYLEHRHVRQARPFF